MKWKQEGLGLHLFLYLLECLRSDVYQRPHADPHITKTNEVQGWKTWLKNIYKHDGKNDSAVLVVLNSTGSQEEDNSKLLMKKEQGRNQGRNARKD